MTDKNDKVESIIENMDLVNQSYFNILLEKFKSPDSSNHIKIADKNEEFTNTDIKAYPTAIATNDLMKSIHVYNYEDIDQALIKKSDLASLWIKKMHAGTGSSLTRDHFLKNIFKNKENISLGAKGTDLYIKIQNEYISLAELQLINLYYFANDHDSNLDIISQDIIGPETRESMLKLWEKKSLLDPKKTYTELFNEHPKLSIIAPKFQSQMPTVDENMELSTKKLAPGGHALFAVDALLAAYNRELRPDVDNSKSLICAIANGEDLSGRPDKSMLGLMIDKKISIAMVTTTKTKNDLKGGQIALIKENDGSVHTTIIEKAQAQSAGQLKLFQEMGLRAEDNIAFFNTNMVLINYNILSPLIESLVADIGEKEFLKIISPDLIHNKKSQTTADGRIEEFIQLEGAMGSTFLNLDKYWRKKYKRGLVSFINIDSQDRTHFFAPIKTAFDFYMQFHSDRFSLNQQSMTLVNNRPDSLPSVTFNHSFYNDLTNVLETFSKTSIISLDKLYINKNEVNLSNLILRKNIFIENNSDKIVYLKELLQDYLSAKMNLDNLISVHKDGRMIVSNIRILINDETKIRIESYETK